jgi:hypothetical protein
VVDALEEAGLVRRETDPHNRRAIRLHLTERGRAFRDDVREARRSAAEDLFAPLTAHDRQALARLLRLADHEPETAPLAADDPGSGGDLAGPARPGRTAVADSAGLSRS